MVLAPETPSIPPEQFLIDQMVRVAQTIGWTPTSTDTRGENIRLVLEKSVDTQNPVVVETHLNQLRNVARSMNWTPTSTDTIGKSIRQTLEREKTRRA